MKGNIIKGAFAAVAIVVIAACSDKGDSQQWSVSGTAAQSDAGTTAYLESASDGQWAVIDSVTIAEDLTYVLKGERPTFPDIYRVTINGNSIYFPIDSLEQIVISADGRISGSHSADMMQRIDDIVADAAQPAAGDDFDQPLKRRVADVMQEQLGGIASYYAINKVVGGVKLFNPSLKFDRRIIGGVATQYNTLHPDDPRSELLKNNALSNMTLYDTSRSASTVVADEIPFPDITLRNADGKTVSLSDTWNNSKATLLVFTLLNSNQSPAFNIALNNVYDKYKSRGLAIYQVGCDEDEYAWELVARNLPWTAVYNSPMHDAINLLSYNVTALPTMYVISGDGNRMERVDDVDQLDSVIARML